MVKKPKNKVTEISDEQIFVHNQIRKNVESLTSGAEPKLSHAKCSKTAMEHLFRLKVYKPPVTPEDFKFIEKEKSKNK
jgi:hypothetical protein